MPIATRRCPSVPRRLDKISKERRDLPKTFLDYHVEEIALREFGLCAPEIVNLLQILTFL